MNGETEIPKRSSSILLRLLEKGTMLATVQLLEDLFLWAVA